MTVAGFKALIDVGLPLARDAAKAIMEAYDGASGERVRSLLRETIATASLRMDKHDRDFAERDAANDARVAALPETFEGLK